MAGGIRGVLLDIDGVLTVSWRPLPGAAGTIEWLRARGMPFRLLTNTTELTRAGVTERLAAAGIAVSPHEVVTAPVLTASYLRAAHPSAPCYVLTAIDLSEDMEGVRMVGEVGDAAAVVVGGATEPFGAIQASHALELILGGAELVAMHRSISWMTDRGLMLDAGVMLVAGLEEATGKRAVVCGKPSRQCFRSAVGLLGVAAADTLMVGDDLQGDVLAARAEGLIGALVRTGKFREQLLTASSEQPDHILDSVAEVPSLLSERD